MPISVGLPAERERRLDFLARQRGRTKAFYARGEEMTYPAAIVRKELGLDNRIFPHRLATKSKRSRRLLREIKAAPAT